MAKNDGIVFYDEMTRFDGPVNTTEVKRVVQMIDLDSVASLSVYKAHTDSLHRLLVEAGGVQA